MTENIRNALRLWGIEEFAHPDPRFQAWLAKTFRNWGLRDDFLNFSLMEVVTLAKDGYDFLYLWDQPTIMLGNDESVFPSIDNGLLNIGGGVNGDALVIDTTIQDDPYSIGFVSHEHIAVGVGVRECLLMVPDLLDVAIERMFDTPNYPTDYFMAEEYWEQIK